MKVCVFGAGAIGGQLAVRLTHGGAAVAVVARGAQLEAIRARGLRLVTRDGTLEARVTASDDPRDLGPQDAVFVSVKTPALPSVAETIGPLLAPRTAAVFVNNGLPWWYFQRHGGPLDGRSLDALDRGGALLRNVGAARTLGGVAYAACTVQAPGIVALSGRDARLVIGELDGSLSPRARALAAILEKGGLATTVSPALRDEVWSKLITNIGPGLLAILTRCAVDAIAAEPACRELLRTLSLEVAAIAQALGRHPDVAIERRLEGWARLHHRPSLLQDLERGRTMEVEALFAAPLALAAEVGVAVPTLERFVALAILRVGAGARTPA